MERQLLNKIKEEVEDFFSKMKIEAEAQVQQEQEQTVQVSVKTEEPQILIGEGGQTLSDIQHLLKIILKRKIPEAQFFVDIDIADYKKKKKEYLRELAKSTADEVSLTKIEKALPAMSAYERRVIHMELQERKDVLAQSQGQEPDRRIVIRPIPTS